MWAMGCCGMTYIYDHRHRVVPIGRPKTTMSGCTLQFTRNSPLRTTLIDEATGKARYKIDTPRKISGSVTQIRELESDTQPRRDWDDEAESDSDDDIIVKYDVKEKSEKDEGNKTTELPELPELPGMSDEIAKIHWFWFESDRIIFRGMKTTRNEFLPKCGKMRG